MASLTTFTKLLINSNGIILARTEIVNDIVVLTGGITNNLEAACRSGHLVNGGVIEDNNGLVYIQREWKARQVVGGYIADGFGFYGWGRVDGVEVYVLTTGTETKYHLRDLLV